MRKGAHWRDGAQACNEAVEAIRQHTALNARVKQGAGDGESRDVAGSGNIPNGFHHEDDVNRQEREHNRAIDGKGEGAHPNKGHGRGGTDSIGREIARGPGDDATDQQAKGYGAGFHDGGAKTFAQDYSYKDREPKTNVFRASPRQGVRGADLGANDKGSCCRTFNTTTRSSSPVLEPALDEGQTNQSDGGAGDQRRKNPS